MEIIIKLYQDKPSRIGIKYAYEHLAIKAYEELVSKYHGQTFNVKLELLRGKLKLNMTLQSNETGIKILYKELEYRLELFEKVKALETQSIEFVHIYMEHNKPYIAKPFKKQQFFQITSVEIVSPDIRFGSKAI